MKKRNMGENNDNKNKETNEKMNEEETKKFQGSGNEAAQKGQEKQREEEPYWFEEKPDLEEEIETLRRELEEEREKHTRTRADLDNLRKRMEREIENKKLHAKKDILTDLLTFLDYFEQARKQVQDQAAAEGINIMARQFYELLDKHGVRPVDCLGKPFDPEDQEGIGYIETNQHPEGCVAEEITTGYKLGDILLRPARVMVASRPAEQEGQAEEKESRDSNESYHDNEENQDNGKEE